MPQLNTATFTSQIFWIVLGFSLFYLFVSRVFCPKVEEMLVERAFYVDRLLRDAQELRTNAEQLENDSVVALETVQRETANDESSLLSRFREQEEKEKNRLSNWFAEQYRTEEAQLRQSSKDVLIYVHDQMEGLVEKAVEKISITKQT
ncbi:MAG: hypothetical protein LBG20_00185 [Holosporaceae bacterium]|jgi:F-type H+-transporting ATPase subunit b|nr:hypothetical protein [Holosporaceae bacterium]